MSTPNDTIPPLDPARFTRRQQILEASGIQAPALPSPSAFINATRTKDLSLLESLLSTATYAEWCSLPSFISHFPINDSNDNLLHLFAVSNLHQIFPLLQRRGEYVNSGTPYSAYREALCARNVRGETPLHAAVGSGSLDTVKAVYGFAWRDQIEVSAEGGVVVGEYEAEWGILDEEWRVPLREFAGIRNNEGRTALEEAQILGKGEIEGWLRRTGEAQGVI